MGKIAQPPFMLHVLWHPENATGQAVADLLRDHFGSHRFRNAAGGAGVRVTFRNTVAPGNQTPLPIDWNGASTVAVIALIDSSLANDSIWMEYVRAIIHEADEIGYTARVFPVAMELGVLGAGIEEQVLRWDNWSGTDMDRHQRLIRSITHEFNRMLRYRLEQIRHPETQGSLESYLKKTQVVLSHSKHDDYGAPIAERIRDWLHNNSALSSFMDFYDIPPGLSFPSVIDYSIKDGVVIAIYTDSYSSREWCRQEILTAKRQNVPLLVVDCLQTIDERAFPYLGNVPFIRVNPDSLDNIDQVVGCLLDEIFKDFLWRCRVESYRESHPLTLFIGHPPELISLTGLFATTGGSGGSIVYPDPPLGAEEAQLFADVAPGVRLYSLAQWIVEQQA